MPVMDGLTAIKKIQEKEQELRKQDPNLPKVLFAVLTAYDLQKL